MTFTVETNADLSFPDGRPINVVNQSGIPTQAIAEDREVQRLARDLGQWVEKAREGVRPGMFNRALYQVSDNPYAQMKVARTALREDDVISGLADATEALAFDGGLKWESANADDADIFNQLSADINLDGKIREMWRETFAVDQFVCAKLWDTAQYSVRGKTEQGNARKKKISIYAPTKLTILRPENVVPIGYGPLRNDDLAWRATITEVDNYWATTESEIDPLMRVFFTGKYKAGLDEERELATWGVDSTQLLTMNPDWVFRHTTTRPDWQKFPDLSLRSTFSTLDLKRQLISSDRATLVGAANYILLIRKGSKDQPATQQEVTNLKEGYQFLAKLPVIISDHRLEIDVIAPKLDFVLKKEAYDSLDARIANRVLATFTSTATRIGATAADTFNAVLSSAIENRRHMIKRTLEREMARAIVEHPKNEGVFETRPSLVFTPRKVSVGVDKDILQAMLTLRTQREISRDTILETLGLDQATEAQRLEIEDKFFDDIFQTAIPFSSPATQPTATPKSDTKAEPKAAPKTPNGTPEAPATSGARGGRPTGGGRTAQSPAKQAVPKTGSGNPSRSN